MKRSIFSIVIGFANICFLNAQGTWTQKADFAGNTRNGEVGFCIGAKCYIGTGTIGTGSPGGPPPQFKDFWEWDSSTNVWTQKANFAGGFRHGAVGFSIENKGYIATGSDFNHAYSDIWAYDPVNNSWAYQSSLPAFAREGAVVFTIGSKAYIGTGYTHQPTILQDLWEWEQPTDTWRQKTDFPGGPRTGAIAFSIGRKGYIAGGSDGNNAQKDLWEWDQATDVWTRKADLPKGASTVFAIGGKGYVGINCANDTLWQWDPSTNVWTFTTYFSGTLCGDIGFSNGIKGYAGIGGGWSQDFWEFDPKVTTSIGKLENTSILSVYPNPASGNVVVTFNCSSVEAIHFSLKDPLGQSVWSSIKTSVTGDIKEKIDIGELSKGVYLLEVICGAERKTAKVIVD